MKLGTFMMPLHPPKRQPHETYIEDREAILLADKLGYAEALVGEHVTDLAENVTSCAMFLASLAHEPEKNVLGTGPVKLTNLQPAARGREARLDADLGQLPAARMGREPLAALRRGLHCHQ